MNKSIYSILFFTLFLFPFATLKAQDNAMLIEQIEGKKITRESFDKKGKLTGKQIFTAGKMARRGGTFFINIKTELYDRSEEHTSELQSLMRISYAVFCLKKKKNINKDTLHT